MSWDKLNKILFDYILVSKLRIKYMMIKAKSAMGHLKRVLVLFVLPTSNKQLFFSAMSQIYLCNNNFYMVRFSLHKRFCKRMVNNRTNIWWKPHH